MSIGAIASGIKAFFGGDTGKEIVGFIRDRWPAKMTEQEAAELELFIGQQQHKKEMDLLEFGAKQDAEFNKRTIAMEGTASDLKSIPYVGAVVIFARGMFRPVFAYFTLYLDYKWLAAGMGALTDRQEAALFTINLIVLVFFFGERAVKNLMPVIGQVFMVKKA